MNRLQQAMKINAAIDHLYVTEDGVSEIMQFNVIYDALLDIDELINAAESEELDEEVEYVVTPGVGQYYDYASEQQDIGNGFVQTEVNYIEQVPDGHDVHFSDKGYTFISYSVAREWIENAEAGGLDASQFATIEQSYELTSAGHDAIDAYDMEHDIFPAVIVDPATGNLTTNFSGQGSLHPEYAVDEEFNDFSPSVGTSEGTAELQELVGQFDPAGKMDILKRAPVDERVYMEFSPTNKPSYVQTTIAKAFEPCGAD